MLTITNHTSERKLLKTPIKNLNLNIDVCPFASPLIKKIFAELDNKGFKLFRPKIYLGDEWFSPEGVAAVSVPFYLTHPKLITLEKKHTGEAEGYKKKIFLALLRHEIGHCIDHTYKLSKTKEWKNVFGNPKKKYNPDNYSFNPKSKDFVVNLEDHYAQAHPDEDFAETFSVWLEKPKTTWKKNYYNRAKALKKLNYIDKIIPKLEDREVIISSNDLICRADKLRISLETYYNRRRKQLA